jgi:hypothetical protein
MTEFDENEIEFARAAVAMMEAGYTPGALWVAGNLRLAQLQANGSSSSSARRLARCRRRSARRWAGAIVSEHETYLS